MNSLEASVRKTACLQASESLEYLQPPIFPLLPLAQTLAYSVLVGLIIALVVVRCA